MSVDGWVPSKDPKLDAVLTGNLHLRIDEVEYHCQRCDRRAANPYA